ncbi:NB-ARC domain-containing protein [Nostoc sp. FACHB-190]|uniref:WD40 domain-containing protein n=1 Tax=Nostoc sp. FACHB-190 TaxID=2692838 RepID=UPI001684AC2A|nr:NB-ARC domain-containing protein [Nostoc sp. FACHB-190]MBD2299069.1 PD40 domain-containing protein [Nostoc sp. FACHB-190]
MRSLKASPEGLKKIKEARERRGLAIDREEWLEEASNFIPPAKNGKKVILTTVSIGTWKRFLGGTPVKPSYFKAFCQVLQLDWEEVVDTEDAFKNQKEDHKPSSTKHDWDAAPDVSIFYDRSIELTTLKQWLINDKCRLVTILAMGGVGKTALAVKLAKEMGGEFDYIIWRSLREAPRVEKIIADVVKFLSQQQEIDLPESLGDKITRLINYLSTSRCLLILDNAESILQSGSSMGNYREGYSGYGELFRRIGESQHQSCLLLTSREQFKEVRRLAGETLPVRFLELAGLSVEAREILTVRGLNGFHSEIEQLINHYHGNALALQIVPEIIKKLFHGNIAAFLKSGTTIFDDIYDLLTQQFERLSETEKCLMYWLAINREAVLETTLTEDVLDLSPRQIREGLDSLLGRCLIQSTNQGLTLQNVVMEYVSDRLITKIIYELESYELYLFRTHAIIKASAPDYIRENQRRMLLQPVAEKFCKNQTKRVIETKFRLIIQKLREEELQIPVGYAGGNLLNLLIQLQINLTGYDLSCLPISQAYLQGVELPEVNFSDCSFEKTVFSQSLGSIFTVAFSPDQKLLATGGMDGQIRFWDMTDGMQVLAWQAHGDWIRCVAFSPDGKLIASCGNDHTVRIWDRESAKCLKIFRGHTDWVWSVYFIWGKRLVVSASSDRTAKVWSLDLGVCVYTFHEPDREVWSFAFSHDAKTLATGGSDSVKLWNVWTNQCLKTFEENSTRVRTLAFSPDGKTLVGSSDNQSIKAWDVKTGKCLRSVKTAPTGAIWAIKFSPDGETVMSCGTDKIQLWNLENGEPQMTLHEPHHRIRSLTYSPDQKMIAVGSDDQLVRLWNTQTGEIIKTFQGYSNRIWTVAVSPVPQQDMICLASGSDDGNIRLWNAASGECDQTLSGHQGRVRHVSFSPDGKLLASASHDRTIKLWDVSTGECLKTWRGHTDWVWSVIFNQNNHTLISASDDHTVLLWDTRSNQSQVLGNLETEWMWAIASHPQAEILATAGTGQTINFWDIHQGVCLTSLKGHTHRIRAITFNGNGQLIASSSDDFSLKLWNIETQQCLQMFLGHQGEIRALTFIPPSSNTPEILVSASDDHTIRLWNTQTGNCIKVLTGHQDRIWSVCYSPQLDVLFSCGEDETIKFWNFSTLKCIKTLRISKPYEGMNIKGVSGLTEATLETLGILGAVRI